MFYNSPFNQDLHLKVSTFVGRSYGSKRGSFLHEPRVTSYDRRHRHQCPVIARRLTWRHTDFRDCVNGNVIRLFFSFVAVLHSSTVLPKSSLIKATGSINHRFASNIKLKKMIGVFFSVFLCVRFFWWVLELGVRTERGGGEAANYLRNANALHVFANSFSWAWTHREL